MTADLFGVLALLATAVWAAYWVMLFRTPTAPLRGRRLLGLGSTVLLLASIAFAFVLGPEWPITAMDLFAGALVIVTLLGIIQFYVGPQ